MEKSPRSGRANVLVLGRKNQKVRELKRIMANALLDVVLVSKWADVAEYFPRSHFDLIVVTDSYMDNLNKNVLVNLKRLYSQAKVLCVFDKITEETEMTMRRVGAVYLGSYDYFVKFSRDILESAVRPNRGQRNRGQIF